MAENKKYPVNIEDGRVECPNIEQRIGDLLAAYAYKFALDYEFELYESDIQWIENNISKNSQNNIRDIFWRLDDTYKNRKAKSKFLLGFQATFFERFIDTYGIPSNVNRLFIYIVGVLSTYYKIKIGPAPNQHFFIESWMRKTRGGGKKASKINVLYKI